MNIEIEKVSLGYICTVDSIKYVFEDFEEMIRFLTGNILLNIEGKSKTFAGSMFGLIEVKYTTKQ